jgi:[acyl-carrier-protein] S-malonyltransferase
MPLAFVFPGQGSQSIGMMAALAQVSPVIEATFAEASEVLGYDLWQRCQAGPAELLNSTECTQPAMLTAGVATYRLWCDRGGPQPKLMAGHSLGEFSALVAAGFLEFKDAVDLVRYRGELMQAAVPSGQGAIAAILGLEDTDVEAACQEAGQGEVVEAVNFNAPGQVVIAGMAAHSSLMKPAAEKLRMRLEATTLANASRISVYGVDVKVHVSPTDIRSGLVRQLHTPVFWAATVRTMISSGAGPIIECGPGKVLTGLNRRVDKNRDLKMMALEDPAALDEALSAVKP